MTENEWRMQRALSRGDGGKMTRETGLNGIGQGQNGDVHAGEQLGMETTQENVGAEL